MAVAAYASLLSFTHVLENLHYRAPFHLPLLDIKRVETLQENVHFLLEFLELHSGMEAQEMKALWRHMATVAFEAEEMVDFHVVNLLYSRSQGETSHADFSAFCQDLDTVISKFDFIKKELPAIHETGENEKPPAFLPAIPPSATCSTGENVIVGFDRHVVSIKDQLTRTKGHLQILPIVGMGGIGTTTLAKCVFDDPYIVDYFDKRIWLTISQQFSVHEILKGLVDVGGNKETCERSADELGIKLYQELFRRKYLIIMDDMWSVEAWDELKSYFPDNGNGSRILVTTRLSSLASSLDSLDHYPIPFLDENASWDLFCQTTFAQFGCPYAELEEIGRGIAKGCRGLPLEISVIGRLLANSEMTQQYWQSVAENMSSFGNLGDNEHCLKVLSLSYTSLPIHLKPCFLYLRVFPEDESIDDVKLIEYWVAEGFIKKASDRSLEEITKQYGKDLLDRNLMFIKKSKWESGIGVHDLLRDLCIRESNNEGFLQSPKVQVWEEYNDLETRNCLLCGKIMRGNVGINICKKSLCFPQTGRDDNPIACDTCETKYSHIKRTKLVKTTTMQRRFWGFHEREKYLEFPTELRYLVLDEVKFIFHFHEISHLLWNLQSLTLPYGCRLPSCIWEMPQLREMIGDRLMANSVTDDIKGKHFFVLNNLLVLGEVVNFKFAKEVPDRVSNLRRLYLKYVDDEGMSRTEKPPHYSLCNIVELQLQVLGVEKALENIGFPISLKMLNLRHCRMAWKDMSIIGLLPVLEIFLLDGGVEGSEWKPVEGEFRRLKDLEIRDVDIEYWTADSIHFPVLVKLKLGILELLEEIPLGIGDIPTLELIDVSGCSDSVTESAKKNMGGSTRYGK